MVAQIKHKSKHRVSSAVDKVVGKSMQSLEKLPVVVWEGSVKHIEQAISGTGNLVAGQRYRLGRKR